MSEQRIREGWRKESVVFHWTKAADEGDNYAQARRMALEYWTDDGVRIIDVRPSYAPVGMRVWAEVPIRRTI